MKYQTSTITEGKEIVPWLASRGPLSYTPETPPPKDYFFQYSWILPDILNPNVNKREHFYFGATHKEFYCRKLLSFWSGSRKKQTKKIYEYFGKKTVDSFETPISVYEDRFAPLDQEEYLFIQHGSYQLVEKKEQPLICEGSVILYRGVQSEKIFSFPKFDVHSLSTSKKRVWQNFLDTYYKVLSDSVTSFNSVHDRAVRAETEHLNDRTFMTNDIAIRHGLDTENDPFAKRIWKASHEAFSLVRYIGERKFGPHYIMAKTPINNIRLTTFFAGEYEVKIIDPNKVEIMETKGCKAERPHIVPGSIR